MKNQRSKFHLYSMGIVAADKDEDGWEIECYPVENMSYRDGNIDDEDVIKITNENIYLKVDDIVLTKRVTVEATWLQLHNTNRITPPNVKKGEQIEIYRYANTDEFFWCTPYYEKDLRRLEKVIHYYGNTTNFMEELNNDNTYWTKIDTINKMVHLHTSDNDGEHTTYDITIDTAAGIMTTLDGKGNYIEFNSSTDTLNVKFNTEVNIEAPTITFTYDLFNLNQGITNFLGGHVFHDGISIDSHHKHADIPDIGE